jgi:hypothetical protein
MECAACKRELAFMSRAQQTFTTVLYKQPDPAFSQELWSRIQAEERMKPKVTSRPWPHWFFAIKDTLKYAVMPLYLARSTLRLASRFVISGSLQVFKAAIL